jgi:hypothetical protein
MRSTSIINKSVQGSGSLFNVFKLVKGIFQQDGITAFWRGGSLAIGKTTLNAAIYLTGIDRFKWLFGHIPGFPERVSNFSAAFLAKTVSAIIISPLIVLKTQTEVAGLKDNVRIRDNFRRTIEHAGIRGLWAGLIPTILKEAPYSGFQYFFYRELLSLMPMEKPENNKLAVGFCGSLSASLAVLITYPFDNLRVRYQCFDLEGGDKTLISGDKKFKSYSEVIAEIYQKEGIRGYFHGFPSMLLKRMFAAPIMWIMYEHFNKGSKDKA